MPTEFGFIDPTFTVGTVKVTMAPRPANLTGKVLGVIDNTKEQADVILKAVADELVGKYGTARVVFRRKEHYSKQAPEAMINEMAKEVQIVVSSLGG